MSKPSPSPFAMPIPGPEVFADDEPPTRPGGLASRSALLVATWRILSQTDQIFLERLAGILPTLSETDRSWLRQIVDVMAFGSTPKT